MKRRVIVGEDFKGPIKFLEASKRYRAEVVRSWIVSAFLGLAVLFLIGAAVYGILGDSFEKLQSVWNIVAAPFGAFVLHYFGSVKDKGHRGLEPNESEDEEGGGQ